MSKALQHQMCHSIYRDVQCSLCMLSFKHNYALRTHERKAHASQVDYLPLKTPSKQVRESQEKGNPCPECGGKFAIWDSLQRHRKSVHGKEQRHTCDECGKLLSHKRQLSQHIRQVHRRIYQKQCELCRKTFSRPYGLQRHIESVHGGDEGKNRQSSA
ncbi:hypothetical protein CRM22_003460 [Opisthorchis felineus]|uniref:C2H2-type domain-containing protein n=1 Tax=Opisthorchis felineus TaxID=147828 RepID=A0A4S2M789_OPIFE|nr:hypothetical protein CRM22_003460 [Opisthorchis felineus]